MHARVARVPHVRCTINLHACIPHNATQKNTYNQTHTHKRKDLFAARVECIILNNAFVDVV